MRIHPNLPIYHIENLRFPILYTPGTLALVERDDVERIKKVWQAGDTINTNDEKDIHSSRLDPQMDWLTSHAQKAKAARNSWLEEQFAPECLTVYLSNLCNLQCIYCFANKGKRRDISASPLDFPVISEDIFQAAADLVGQNCIRKNKPFHLVLHGGGEPTLHWDLLHNLVDISRKTAHRNGLEWTGYIATNGVLPLECLDWLTESFQRIGVSCDGPPDIQNRQRPSAHLGQTSDSVVQTALAIRKSNAQLEIRTTITPETSDRQQEILLYLVRELGAEIIRFEPVYQIGKQNNRQEFLPDEAEHFAAQYMQALQTATELGVELSFSGIRLQDLHGPYCNTFRQCLHLTPEGKASSCFFCVDGNDPLFSNRIIGEFDRKTHTFQLDHDKIARLRACATIIDNQCRNCFAAYHCSRSCPEICSAVLHSKAVSPFPYLPESATFRCRLNRAIGSQLIEQAAKEMVIAENVSNASRQSADIPVQMEKVLNSISSDIRGRVIDQWLLIKDAFPVKKRILPPPLWQKNGFQLNSGQTWHALDRIMEHSLPEPISMYIHIPFCDSRCTFCDCYSISTPPNHRFHSEYVQLLLREISHWAKKGNVSSRPVTTIHFGGGTPGFLSPYKLGTIITALSENFSITNETEWALESTVRLLEPDQIASLRKMGFSRLHIGVQTLEGSLRKHIGRQEPAKSVLKKIDSCLASGLITTVDLLYGLPGETPAAFFTTISRLIKMGVHGISFYQFNHSKRNHTFVRQYQTEQQDIFHNYSMFTAADHIMISAGFQKNHFAHYSIQPDRNLYYTHARRKEDLLALGASADGVFAGLHYRYPELCGSLLSRNKERPLFQGGIMETRAQQKASLAIAQLMTGAISEDVVNELQLTELIGKWQPFFLEQNGYGEPDLFKKIFMLTGNGSWFINDMIKEVEQTVFHLNSAHKT